MNLRTKHFFAAFVILVLSSKSFAQEQPNLISPTKVTTIGYWNIGDKIVYHVVASDVTSKSNAAQPTKQSTNTYDLEIKVVDSTEHSYKLEMRYLTGSVEGMDPQLQEMMNSWQTTTVIRYQTDEFGSFEKILNLIELQKDFQKKCNEFKKQVAINRTPEEAKTLTKTLDVILVQFSKPENLEVIYMSDIMAIHANYGIELTLNKPMEVDIEFPCFNNVDLMGTGKILLQSINKAKDIATFSITSKPNQEELKKYMKSFFEQLVPDNKENVKLEEMNIQFENKEISVIHLSNGWMETIETSRTATVILGKDRTKKVTSARYQRK